MFDAGPVEVTRMWVGKYYLDTSAAMLVLLKRLTDPVFPKLFGG